MNDTNGVGSVECGGDLAGDGEYFVRSEAAGAFETGGEGFSGEELHGEEDEGARGAFRCGESVAVEVEGAADVWVGDAAR